MSALISELALVLSQLGPAFSPEVRELVIVYSTTTGLADLAVYWCPDHVLSFAALQSAERHLRWKVQASLDDAVAAHRCLCYDFWDYKEAKRHLAEMTLHFQLAGDHPWLVRDVQPSERAFRQYEASDGRPIRCDTCRDCREYIELIRKFLEWNGVWRE